MPGAWRAPEPTAGLIADVAGLDGGGGEEDGGGVWRGVGWADDDLGFVLLGLVGVFNEFEAELADVER